MVDQVSVWSDMIIYCTNTFYLPPGVGCLCALFYRGLQVGLGTSARVGVHNLYIIGFLDCRAVQVVVNYAYLQISVQRISSSLSGATSCMFTL